MDGIIVSKAATGEAIKAAANGILNGGVAQSAVAPINVGVVGGAVSAGAGVGASAKLAEAIAILSVKRTLDSASKVASEISSIFNGANPGLSDSWSTVSNFASTINNNVEQLIKRFSDELQSFAATTEQNELEITTATNSANDMASKILSELGLR